MMAKKKGLGEKHEAIFKYLEARQMQNLPSPTIREIQEACNISSTSLVNYYLGQMEEAGWIARDRKISRGIRLLKTRFSNTPPLRVPLIGQIVASEPAPVPPSDFSYFTAEDVVEVPQSILRKVDEDVYALRVKGTSMIDAMINDGDIVIMKPAQDASNGEMVAVWLAAKDETTLKYFYRENGRIRLQPANPTMQPIYIDDSKDLRIQGKVVAVIRQT